MSDEEKKAIEILKKLQKKTPYIIWGDGTPYNKSNQIQTILNLIEKLQKEIKRLNFENHMVKKWNEQLDKNCISKDKIREKIKEYDKWIKEGGDYTESLEAQRYALKELLEEE